MMENKILVLFTLVLLIVPSVVLADALIPGTKGIISCNEISNTNDYQEYVFIAYPVDMSAGYNIVQQNTCISFYKFVEPSIYAVKKSNFNEVELQGKNYTELQDYFKNNPQVIHSDILIGAYGTVAENDPLDKVVTVLGVVSLNESNLEIQKSKIIYTYTDGSSEEKIISNQNVIPDPSRKAILPWWVFEFWYIIVPVVALVVIVIILLLRRK